MNKKNTYILIFSIFIVFFSWALQDFLFKTKAQRLFLTSIYNVQNSFYDKSMNNQNWGYWKNRYITKIHSVEDAYIAIDSALESLDDPYTRFLRPDEFKEQSMNISAKLHGIGVNITQLGSNVTIVGVLEDTPAQKAGLKIGDIILKIDDKDIKGLKLNEIADLIRGEINTKVSLKISRDKKIVVKEGDKVIYSERTIQGDMAVSVNESGEDSSLSIELLFNATVTNPHAIAAIFNQK